MSGIAVSRGAINELRFLSPGEARLLLAIAERMVRGVENDGPSVAEVGGLEIMDAYLATLPQGLGKQLRMALRAVQWGPLIFLGRPTTFTRMRVAEQDRYLRGWGQSRLAPRRQIYRALRNLACIGYYGSRPLRAALLGEECA